MGGVTLYQTEALPLSLSARWRGLSTFQFLAILILSTGVMSGVAFAPHLLASLTMWTAGAVFGAASAVRLILVWMTRRRSVSPPSPSNWPPYTIVCALHDEPHVVGQLIRGLARIDYPVDRLQGLIVLEQHDIATRDAALATPRPDWLRILTVPPGSPQTKPRALNEALKQATGEYLTIYDAEDTPDPGQLREAASRFASERDGRTGCLQAPLRIRRRHAALDPTPFVDRQFAAEYAALFEVVLPGLAKFGFPFPLGGTSNHFRVDALRRLGAWDAHNVTEDADLGFRLWRAGYRLGVLSTPTWETPPGPVSHWLPQRTRWLKGYMQTFGVHTRRPWELGWRGGAAFLLTVGAGLVSAACHGPSLLWVAAALMLAAASATSPALPALGLLILGAGVLVAWLTCAVGSRRAGLGYGLREMAEAPLYWSMLSLAFAHAAWRLLVQPFAWDKTPHRADTADGHPDVLETMLDARPPGVLSAGHVAAPEPVV